MNGKRFLGIFACLFLAFAITLASAGSIDFIAPTPANGSSQGADSIYVNISTSSATQHYTILDFKNSLVGWWRLEQGNGTMFADESSKSNNATCPNGKCPNYTASGQYGGAYTFNGSQYINMSYKQDFNESAPGANFSYGGWLYLNPGQIANFYPMGRGYASAQTPFGFWFAASGNAVNFLVGKGPQSGGICTDWLTTNNLQSTWQANVWQHWFFVKKGFQIYLYKNGTRVSSYTMSNDTICDVANLPFVIGASYAATGYMNGSADEVVFFNRALNHSEVAALYNASASQYYNNFTGLASGSYNFTGYTIDSAGNKNSTDLRIIILTDGVAPTSVLSSPAAGYTTSTSNTANITFQCNATDNSALANISLYVTSSNNQSFRLNQTTSITGVSNSTNWTLVMAPGNYTWNCLAYDSAGNSAFASANRSFRIDYTPDTVYPIFSNYWDNNATLDGSGRGLFNVTVANTNGSVYLNINGQSIQATNLTANIYNASYDFSSGGTYTYNWSAYGNGTNNNLNTTTNFNYIVYALNLTNFYQYPANVSPGGNVYSYCIANSTRNSTGQLNITLGYKNNASSTWQQAASNYLRRITIWSIGDSITRGSSDYNPSSPAGPSNPVNHSYQYWLDYYMNSNASGLDGSGISIYNKGAGSDTCEGMASRFNSSVGNNSIVILMCGINDFSLGRNYTQAEDSVLTIYAEAMAKNDTLIILEVIPDGNGLFCGNLTPFNAWLDSNFVGTPNVKVVAGLHSAMTSGTYCYYNSSLFDGVHPNTLGHKFIGRYIWQALNEQYYESWTANITIPSNENSSFYDFNCNVSDGIASSSSVNYKSVNITSLPSISIVSPANATYNNRTLLVDISSNGNYIWFTNSSGQNESYTTPVYRIWNEGNNTIHAYANDSLGYLNSTSIVFNIDSTLPNATILAPQNATITNITLQNFTLNVSDNQGLGNATLYIYNETGLYNQTTISLGGASQSVIGVVVNLVAGVYSWFWEVFDVVGNVFNTQTAGGNRTMTVDTTNPQISINSPLNATYTNATILIDLTSAGAYTQFYNGTAWEIYTTPVYRTFPQGSTTLTAYTNDSAGNANSTSVIFFVDTVAPSISIVSPANATYNNRNILVNISSSGDYIWFTNSSGQNESYTTPVYGIWNEGSNTIYAYANDSAGNLNSTSIVFNIDTSAPSLSIASPANATYNNRTLLVNISSNGNYVWFVNASGQNESYTTPVYRTWNEGSNTIYAYANNSAGNSNSTSLQFFVDSTAPAINFTAPTPSNGSLQESTSIYVNVSSSDTNTHYVINNFDNSLVGWWRLEQGNGTVFVDESGRGNNETCSGGRCPAYNASGKYGGAYTFNGSQYINMSYKQDFNESSPGANFSYGGWLYLYPNQPANFYPMGRGFAGSQTPFSFWFAATGNLVKFIVGKGPEVGGICTDWLSSGNLQSTWEPNVWQHWFFVKKGFQIYLYKNGTRVSSYTMSNDTICDVANIPFMIGAGAGSAGPMIGGTHGSVNGSVDEVIFFNRALNNSEIAALYNASTNQYYNNFTGLTEGAHTFKAYAVDSAGNKNSTEMRNVTIQIVPPLASISIIGPQNTSYTNRTLLVNISSNGNYTWFVNSSGQNESYTTPVYRIWNEGSNTIYAYANNSAGNVSSTNITFFIDSIPPAIAIISPANANYNSKTLLVNISSDGNYVWFTNSSGQNESYTTPVYRIWNEGSNTIYAYANDSAGNVNSTSVIFNVDTTAPIVNIVRPTDGGTFGYNESIELNFSVSDAHSTNCWYNLDNSANKTIANCINTTFNTTNGAHVLRLYANDSLGNVGSDEVNFSVDIGSPTISLISPAASTYLNYTNSIEFVYSATDINLASCELWGNFNGTFALNQTNSSVVSGAISKFYLNLSDGSYLWNIICNDTEGNSAANGNKTFYVDTIAPSIVISEPTGTKTSLTGIPLTYNAIDASPISCRYNVSYIASGITLVGNTYIENCSGTTFAVDSYSNYILRLTVNDSAGNIAYANSTFSVSSSNNNNNGGGGGGGGGGGRTIIIPANNTLKTNTTITLGIAKITIEQLQNLVVNPGESKKLSLSVLNSGTKFLNGCRIKSSGKLEKWISSDDVKDLNIGEKKDFIFNLNVPKDTNSEKYNITLSLSCDEIRQAIPLGIEIIKKKLDVSLIEAKRDKDKLNIIYSLSEMAGQEQNVSVEILLVGTNNAKVAQLTEKKTIAANAEKKFETSLQLPKSAAGNLNLLINANSPIASAFVQQDVLLEGSHVTGFASFLDSSSAANYFNAALVVAFLVFAFFVVRRMLRTKGIEGRKNIISAIISSIRERKHYHQDKNGETMVLTL
jgi:lysophospholipase L1-like esterase